MKCFVSRDPLIMVKAYTAFVRPLLEYCTCTCNGHRIIKVSLISLNECKNSSQRELKE